MTINTQLLKELSCLNEGQANRMPRQSHVCFGRLEVWKSEVAVFMLLAKNVETHDSVQPCTAFERTITANARR